MKLFGVICLLSVQVSDGLRLIGSTRAFLNKVTDAVNVAAASNHEKFAALVVCSVITCSLGLPSPSLAAGNGIASDLFAKAESSIASNLQDYKSLDKEWSTAKKLILDNGNILSKASNSLGVVSKQMTGYDEIMSNMITEDITASSELRSEIDALKLSTGMKYAAAEASSAVPEKPSITSQLFLVAQNEAMILEQSEISLKKFSDAIGPPGAYVIGTMIRLLHYILLHSALLCSVLLSTSFFCPVLFCFALFCSVLFSNLFPCVFYRTLLFLIHFIFSLYISQYKLLPLLFSFASNDFKNAFCYNKNHQF